jgi:hypothetical protein
MGTKSRENIYGASVRASEERAAEARRKADRLACEAWNKRMMAFQGPAQPSQRWATRSMPATSTSKSNVSAATPTRRSPWMTPIHELERYMRCRHCSELQGNPFKRSH